jgi:hypothetical protein
MSVTANACAKRSAPPRPSTQINTYFDTITNMDVDDCGKLLVCQLETVSAEERCPEENMITSLFGESSTINPEVTNINFFLISYHINIMAQKVIYYHVNIISKKVICDSYYIIYP